MFLHKSDHATIEGETFSLDAILRGSVDSDDYEVGIEQMAGIYLGFLKK